MRCAQARSFLLGFRCVLFFVRYSFQSFAGKPVTAGWVRKRLYLAREKLGELLLEEIRQSLDTPSEADMVQELIELNLLKYCRSALERRRSGQQQKEGDRGLSKSLYQSL